MMRRFFSGKPGSRLEQLRAQLAEDGGKQHTSFADPNAAVRRHNPAPVAPPPDADCLPPPDPVKRSRALSLYRQLLRAARGVPTEHRRSHIARRTRGEFEDSRWERSPAQVDFLLQLAETHLDTVLVQAGHLQQQVDDPRFAAQWQHEKSDGR